MFEMNKMVVMFLCLLLFAFPALANTAGRAGETRTDLSADLCGAYIEAETRAEDDEYGLSPEWHTWVEDSRTEAVDITLQSRIRVNRNGNDRERLTDDRYKTYWDGGVHAWIEFTLPEETPCYGIYVKWAEELTGYRIERMDADGNWQQVGKRHEATYYNEYIPVDALSHFRIINDLSDRTMCITEIQLLSSGAVPDWVQRWKPFEGYADLLVLSAHPDDEILWFGGTIPYYRGERLKKVLVVNVSQQPASRKCELLDCLWTCGIREYPVLTGGNAFIDRYASQVRDILAMWGEENLLQFITGIIRQYRPLVAVTHDFNGEYGHGAHKSCAYALTKCLRLAADPTYLLSGERASLPPWQIQKVYIHLYEENPVEMDWRAPMEAFGGKTGFEVASEAFERHRTQHTGKYAVKDYGKHDNRKFGLYFSAVGPDVLGGDFFENITEERGTEIPQ